MYSYMDESCDEQGKGVFVVGGLLMRGVASFELERMWEKLRKRSDIDIAYFKASECKNGRGEFAKFVAIPGSPTATEHQKLDSISREFLSLIPKEGHIVIQGVGVIQTEFYEVIQDTNACAVLGDNPYRLAYDFAMIQCAWAMKQLEEEITKDKANVAKYMGTFESTNDKRVEVLQAADAVAFEIRRVLGLALGNYSALRAQFRDLADPRKVFLITHDQRSAIAYCRSPQTR